MFKTRSTISDLCEDDGRLFCKRELRDSVDHYVSLPKTKLYKANRKMLCLENALPIAFPSYCQFRLCLFLR
jgi:hypothetical protein